MAIKGETKKKPPPAPQPAPEPSKSKVPVKIRICRRNTEYPTLDLMITANVRYLVNNGCTVMSSDEIEQCVERIRAWLIKAIEKEQKKYDQH